MPGTSKRSRRWPNNSGQCWSCAARGVVAAGAMSVVVLLILFGSGWLATRGVQVGRAECEWDASARVYRASVPVRNTEDATKTVRVRIQGRFRPPAEAQWPSTSLRQMYADTSQFGSVVLGPRAEQRAQIEFSIPGVERFACRAEASVDQQERLTSGSTASRSSTAL